MSRSEAAPTATRAPMMPWVIAALFVPLSIAYRALIMDAFLAGFTDDDFGHLSRAQLIVLGDLPVRDFVELGMPLTEALSALAQLLLGRMLLPEFVLTTTLLGVAAGLLFVLVTRASGSAWIGLVPAVLLLVLEPRLYNYPKLLVYALAIPLLWRYLERPAPARAAAVGAVGALAFLFRHDHGVYVGAAAVVMLAAAHWRAPRTLARPALAAAATGLALVLPYLVFVQAHQGVLAYIQSGVEWAERDAARTARGPQRIEVGWFEPPVAISPVPAPVVGVRWREGTPPEARAGAEQAHGLRTVEVREANLVRYELSDWSRAGLEALVGDPRIADTSGIDRGQFVIDSADYDRSTGLFARVRVLPGLLREANAVPFLFFLFSSLPFVSLALLLARWRKAADPLGEAWRAKVLVVVALAFLVNVGFLRGALASRLPDVMVPAGVLAAWLAGEIRAVPPGLARKGLAIAALVLVATAGLSALTLRDVPRRLSGAGLGVSVEAVGAHLQGLGSRLTAEPPVDAYGPNPPGRLQMAHYLRSCLTPRDRVLLVTYAAELAVFSGRGLAGGLHAIQPGFFASEADQRRLLDRVAGQRVPVVLTVPREEYEEDYRAEFPLLDAFLAESYQDVSGAAGSGELPYRVLVRRDLAPVGHYAPLDLPCYATSGA